MEALQRVYQSGLNGTAVQIYQYLLLRANRSGKCFPGHRTIAADTKRSVSTVKRCIKELEQAGFIKKESRKRPNGGDTSNLYTIVTA